MRAWWEQLRARGIKPAVLLGYLLVVALFVGAFAQYYIPEKGFSYLISFGGRQPHPPIAALQHLEYYVQADSDGYDAQYYVQIAMAPSLRDPQLKDAVDSLAYRARRILISWASYAMGLGRPASILKAYVLQNAISWLILAGVLLYWFPPSNWSNWLRWTGVLFSFGMCVSVRNSLVDGPSLLLIAVGVLLLEKGKPWWSTAVLALGGLGKETNLLGAAALLRQTDVMSPRRWPLLILRGLLVALPLALWLVYIQKVVGPAADLGHRNFDWPFMAYGRKWSEVWTGLWDQNNWSHGILESGPLWSLLMLLSVSVQVLFLFLRPTGREAWWRVGISFAVLFFVLGDAVWEGYPGAASRVLLPLQLAFNVLVPTGRLWLPVLLLGNLTLLNAPAAMQPPVGDGYKLDAPQSLQISAEGVRMRVTFSQGWHEPERYREDYWRWCHGSTHVMILNPHAFPLDASMNFILSSLEKRSIEITNETGESLWQGDIADFVTRVHLPHVMLQPGQNRLDFITSDTISKASQDPRPLTFCLKDWVISLRLASQNGVVVTGPAALLHGAGEQSGIVVDFHNGWYNAEQFRDDYWRWTEGPAELIILNRHPMPVHTDFSFVLNAISKRTAILADGNGETIWTDEISSKHSAEVLRTDLILQPGENRFHLSSSLPRGGADGDARLLDLCLKKLRIDIRP
ncbi:MAG: hypothetical protein K9M98_09475 [Cephaloticoccus sp.]|nr:hypothetical protein [Cephaloticoccus sp.]